ncbi:MAG: hypothetical protein MNSN_03200 [Minisyncoccus archaeiphilus]|uniref:hypothetical protein n=1 Tax=Minisyncoccus archaeiphilus TaxID=3238481 RepID=UPI002B0BF8AA|nr:MAG: hypothetical protein MNSN_03200 [Candidatus Parcubacteria bacterium]
MSKKHIIFIVLFLLVTSAIVFLFVLMGKDNNVKLHESGKIASLDGCNITEENVLRLHDMGMVCEPYCRYNNVDNQCGPCCLLNSTFSVSNWIFMVILLLSGFMMFYSGYLFVMTGNNPSNIERARKIVIFSGVGIGVALFSRAIPYLVKFVLGF